MTGIRIDAGSLSRVRAMLVINSVVGAIFPSVSADVVDGHLRFLIASGGNPATSMTWTLDTQLTHSVQQARDPVPGAYITMVYGAGVGGPAVAQNLAQTYDFGASAAAQTMTIDTAKGGTVVVEASTAAVTADGPGLEVRQSATWSTPLLNSQRGDIVGSAVVEFTKARGTYAAPTGMAAADKIGTIEFTGYYNAAFRPCGRIQSICLTADESFGAGLDFYVDSSADPSMSRLWRMEGSAVGASTLTCFGANPYIVPSVIDTGHLGSEGLYWSSIDAGTESLRHASADATASYVSFYKARGTPAVPAVVQVADRVGQILFNGYNGGGYTQLGSIFAQVVGVAPFPTSLTITLMDHAGVEHTILSMQDTGELPGPYVALHNDGSFIPNNTGEGAVGVSDHIWREAHINTINAYTNVLLGGAVLGGGAAHTILLPNDATMPVPQANQVYLGSVDFTGGTNLAVLAISAEEPTVAVGATVVDVLIPVQYNGTGFYLHATTVGA